MTTKDLPVQSTELDQKIFLSSATSRPIFPNFAAAFADHLGEGQFCPCKDQDIVGVSQTRHPQPTKRRGTNLHLTEPSVIASFPVRSQSS